MWPEPAECARGQQPIDKTVDHFLHGHAPWLPFPNRTAQASETVSEERRGAGYAKHCEVVSIRGNCVPREISDEETHHQGVDEPLDQVLRHVGRTRWKDGHHPDRPLFVFFLNGGRLHVLMVAEGKNIEAAFQIRTP